MRSVVGIAVAVRPLSVQTALSSSKPFCSQSNLSTILSFSLVMMKQSCDHFVSAVLSPVDFALSLSPHSL